MAGGSSAEARHSIKNISRIIFDSVAIKQIKELFLKTPSLVMLVLIANIFNDSLLQRIADAERRVSFLPREPSPIRESLSDPSRRIGLECVYQIGDGNRRRHGGVQMDVIRPAVSLYEPGMLEANNGTHVCIKTMAPLRINEAFPPLGTPNDMEIYTEIFPGHILSNWTARKLVGKISVGGAAPSALDSGPRLSRPYGRAYELAALWALALC